MNILVDSGASNNLGDIGMLESVATRLLRILPGANLSVVDRYGIRTTLWEVPQVRRQEPYSVRGRFFDFLWNVPFFWRYANSWRQVTSRLYLAWFRTLLRPGSLHALPHKELGVHTTTLSEFCEPFDALHVVGGGNLTDVFYGELFRRCCLILTFAEQGKPVVLTGQQLGPFTSSLSKIGLVHALRNATFVGLRDSVDSLDFCREARLDPQRFDLTGDDSLGLDPAGESLVSGVLARYGLKPNGFLAVNVRIGGYAQEHAGHLQMVAGLVDAVAREFQLPVVVVPIALGPGDSDLESGRKLAQLARFARVQVIAEDGLAPALVKGLLGEAFGAIGVSHHFCTFALSQGVPAVCLHDGDYYSQKAHGLCGFWQDKRLALPLRNVSADAGAEHIDQVLKDQLLRGRLRLLSEEARERWQAIFDRHVIEAFGEIC